jgi:hypothetical protein
MAPTISIRHATPSDCEWAAALMTGSEPWMRLGRTLEASLASVADAEYHVFVAHQDNHPLGFLILDPRGVAGAPTSNLLACARTLEAAASGRN